MSLAKMITMGQNLKMIRREFGQVSFSETYGGYFCATGKKYDEDLQREPSLSPLRGFLFMYGMAFMIASPAVPIYLVDVLQLSYSPISIAKGLVFYTATILLLRSWEGFTEQATPQSSADIYFCFCFSIRCP